MFVFFCDIAVSICDAMGFICDISGCDFYIIQSSSITMVSDTNSINSNALSIINYLMIRIIIVYGEFTSLLVERTYGIGTSSPTLMLKWFGGGRILYRMQI